MSAESSAKVQQLYSESQQSGVKNILAAQIGYQKDASGFHLSQSMSGLHFLGLAACLVTVDHCTAAKALQELIADSAVDRAIIPTSQQLEDLIHALAYKLTKSGFADSVLIWGIWLESTTQKTCVMVNPQSGKVIRQVVKATSSLRLLGQAYRLHTRIPQNLAAWVIAFLEWSLGNQPSVMMSSKKTLLTQPDSPVLVELMMMVQGRCRRVQGAA
jgi:hypothetical protein